MAKTGQRGAHTLLTIPAEQKITSFQQLQQTATRPSPEAFGREIDHLEQVRTLLPDTLDLTDLPEALQRFALSSSARAGMKCYGWWRR